MRFVVAAGLSVPSKKHTELKSVSAYLPGFPPIPGHRSTGAEQGFVAALVAADKLTAANAGETADGENDEEVWR